MIGADRFIDDLPDDRQKLHAMQRYRDGFSDIDMWNCDTFVCDVIVACCDWTIENAHTSPWHLEEQEWKAILTKIRDGFAYRNGFNAPEPTDEAWELLKTHFKYFWD